MQPQNAWTDYPIAELGDPSGIRAPLKGSKPGQLLTRSLYNSNQNQVEMVGSPGVQEA